jgi:MurNAc alpha-1-phosphate uridylyltransferase
MNAMILAAGLGTRLRPLTNDRPKALVELNGITLLEFTIRRLAYFGIDTFYINVHHFADKVESFLESKENFGKNIFISDERSALLETGGGIKKVFKDHKLKGDLLVYNTDIISDLNIHEFIQEHKQSDADASLSVKKRNSSRHLLFDNNNELIGWKHNIKNEFKWRKSPAETFTSLAFSGIHIIGENFLHAFQTEDKFSIIDTYLNDSTLKIKGIEHSNFQFVDAGKHETLNSAEILMKKLEIASYE